MLNLFQHPFVKCFVCMGLRVKSAMTEMRKIGFLEVPLNKNGIFVNSAARGWVLRVR